MMDRTNVLQQTNRRVLQRLSPAGLEELGLARALEALADGWRADQPATEVILNVEAAIDQLDPTTSLTIYRLVQEGLTNAFRHARATRISAEVSLIERPAVQAQITVMDNGDGISSTPEDGFGLRGMRERVSALGGQLSIGPSLGGGTTLRATIPLVAA
jgi:two-component system sensor histidine kinase UhpB